jgi:apolipoprotein N-acyltransferase
LYVLVLLIVAGLAVWIAFSNPRLAAAIGFGLFVLVTLVALVRRPPR